MANFFGRTGMGGPVGEEAQYEETIRRRREFEMKQAANLRAGRLRAAQVGVRDPGAIRSDLTDEARIKELRKQAAFEGILSQAPDWEGNRFFRAAFEKAYEDPASGIMRVHEREMWRTSDPGGEHGAPQKSFQRFASFDVETQNIWAHRLAGEATEAFGRRSAEFRSKTAMGRIRAGRAATGGVGRRGTVLTSGRGLKRGAEVERQRLTGR